MSEARGIHLPNSVGITPKPEVARLFQDAFLPDLRDPAKLCVFSCPKNWGKSTNKKAGTSMRALERAEDIIRDLHCNPQSILPVVCDGSVLYGNGITPSPGAYSVVIPDREQALQAQIRVQTPNMGFDERENPIRWTELAVGHPRVYESDNSEMLAVLEALKVVEHLRSATPGYSPCLQASTPLLYVPILTDSQNAIDIIRNGQVMGSQSLSNTVAKPVVSEIIGLLADLVTITCYLGMIRILGHGHDIEPHNKADKIARHTAQETKESGTEVNIFLVC